MARQDLKGSISWVWYVDCRDLTREQKDRLHEHAEEHAAEMAADGYREGELLLTLDKDYKGWFRVKED